MAASLKSYLQKKFGDRLNITTFQSSENCLKNLDRQTHVVILDHHANSLQEVEMMRSIKAINPQTEVIMFTDEAGIAAELYRKGSRGYVTKNNYLLNSIPRLINRTITEPARYIIREFGVSTFMAIFLTTFISMGLVVYFVLKHFHSLNG